MQSLLFTNWSDETFTHTWDSEEFTFQPGQSIYLQDYLARHFAKHLANRELTKKGKVGETDYTMYLGNENSIIFKEFMDKALSQALQAETPIQAEIDTINRNEELTSDLPAPKKFCESCDSKGVRHKKDCPSLKAVSTEEEEFAGLKE